MQKTLALLCTTIMIKHYDYMDAYNYTMPLIERIID